MRQIGIVLLVLFLGFIVIKYVVGFILANILNIAIIALIAAGILWIAIKGTKWLLQDAFNFRKKPKSADKSLDELIKSINKK